VQVLPFSVGQFNPITKGGVFDGRDAEVVDVVNKKVAERCEAMFDEHRCSKPKGHWGKHFCTDDCVSVGWTDAGKARVLRERAEAQQKKR